MEMKIMKTTNNVTKQDELSRLSDEFNRLQMNSRSKYNDRVYMNLPVTRLERAFFKLMAGNLNTDKTKLLRRIIGRAMDKYPNLVTQAKSIVDEDNDIDAQ